MVKLSFVKDDGGRKAAGFNGERAGDCVARAIAIASGRPYREVYDRLALIEASTKRTKHRPKGRRRSARNGVLTHRVPFKRYMEELGFRWVPTMRIGQGCKVHLADGELPSGRLVVSVSRHYTAVIDGVIRDTYDPRRTTIEVGQRDGEPYRREYDRCVYGYWVI